MSVEHNIRFIAIGGSQLPIGGEKCNLKAFCARHSQKLRFLLVGAVNTLFGVVSYPVVFHLLAGLRLHYFVILLISQCVCITWSYATNKMWVFRTGGWAIAEYLRFASYYGLYFAANLVLLPFAVEVLKQDPVQSQVVISLASVFATYFWHSRITFVSRDQ